MAFAASTARGQVRGPEVRGTARLLAGDEADEAHRLLAAKYGIQLRLLELVQLIARATPAYYEVWLG
jgi:hypothetical protein